MKERWLGILGVVEYALQPIVSSHTAECLGYEALLRGYKRAGFHSIQGLLDDAYREGSLHEVDLLLRRKAIESFQARCDPERTKLFYNLDARVVGASGDSPGETRSILERFGLSTASVCFEVSERHPFSSWAAADSVLGRYRSQGYSIAIDDYGVGHSGLKRMYQCDIDYIKIDGFFLTDIATNMRKKLFVSHIVELAHILGIKVIAERIETEAQFHACRSAGCDFVQGFLIETPVEGSRRLPRYYERVLHMAQDKRRSDAPDKTIVLEQVESIEPIQSHADMGGLLEAFRQNPSHNFIPVVNDLDEPLGIVREPDIKDYVYSRYGRELMINPAMRGRLLDFVSRCPVAEITTDLDKMLEVFSSARDPELLILTEGGRYRGFLSARSLLMALNEKNLAVARDQNPLTRLPGNSLITEYIANALRQADSASMFVYFDLDNFKAFNDVYGFRQGDRAILLLADLLKEAAHGRSVFVGHIGGDDLFAGFDGRDWDTEEVLGWARGVVENYNQAVVSLLAPEDRSRGYVFASDRSGATRRFPLVGVSCAVLVVPAGGSRPSADALGAMIAAGKKLAKESNDKIHLAHATRLPDYPSIEASERTATILGA